jgi:hypothetical protein
MTEPFLLSVFNEIRQDERLADPGLDAYFLALELFRKDKQQVNGSFSQAVFLLAALWLKSRDGSEAFYQIMERRRQTLLAFMEFIANEPEGVKKKEMQKPLPLVPSDDKDKKVSQPSSPDPLPQELPPSGAETKNTAAKVQKKQWFGDTAFTMDQSLVQPNIIGPEIAAEQPAAKSESPFILSNEFFPVRSRQLQQAWRALKSPAKGPDSAQISIKMTVYQSARQGIFSDFSYEKEKVNQLRLFILIDRSERMAAVEDFGLELARTVSAGNEHPDVRPWFFARVPRYLKETDDYLVNSEDFRSSCSLEQLFRDMPHKNRAVLIYSDAGVFGYEWTKVRDEATQKMIRWLLPRTGTLAWVNPAPRERWTEDAYADLRRLIPMFSTDGTDINQAIDALRGKVNLKPGPHAA